MHKQLASGWTQLPTAAPGTPAVNKAMSHFVKTLELFVMHSIAIEWTLGQTNEKIAASEWSERHPSSLLENRVTITVPWNLQAECAEDTKKIHLHQTLDNQAAFSPSLNAAQKQSVKPNSENRKCGICGKMQRGTLQPGHLWQRLYLRPLLPVLGWEQVCCWSGTSTSPICVVQML